MVMNKRKVTIGLCLVVFALGIVYGIHKHKDEYWEVFPLEMRNEFLAHPTFESCLDIDLEYRYCLNPYDVFIYCLWAADKYEGKQAEWAEKELERQLTDSVSDDSILIFAPNEDFLNFAHNFLEIK